MQDRAFFRSVLTNTAAGLVSLFDSQQENDLFLRLWRTLSHIPPATVLLHAFMPTLLPFPFWKEERVLPFSAFHLETKKGQAFCWMTFKCRIAG